MPDPNNPLEVTLRQIKNIVDEAVQLRVYTTLQKMHLRALLINFKNQEISLFLADINADERQRAYARGRRFRAAGPSTKVDNLTIWRRRAETSGPPGETPNGGGRLI